MQHQALSFFRQCFSRVAVYYCLIGLLLVVCVDIEKVKLARINFLQDSVEYPVLYLTRRAAFDAREFRRVKKYYQAMARIIPYYEKADMVFKPTALSRVYAMIAACDYYLNNTQEAIVYFKKAVELGPKEFWLNYNLGLVYFKQGQYTMASTYLRKSALATEKDLQQSMQLDYVEFWPQELSQRYKALSFVFFRQVVDNSNKLIALADEQMKNIAAENKPQKADALADRFDLFYNVSLYFVPIGQEKLFIGKRNYLNNARLGVGQ